MTIKLYDLVGQDDRRFSPHCWRTRLAIAHKQLDCDVVPTAFTEIGTIADGQQKTVPVIEDGGSVHRDSRAIAEYLDVAYPDRPSLFGDDGTRTLTDFVEAWASFTVAAALAPMIVKDIHDHLLPEDQAYFRTTREKRFGVSLEDAQEGRKDRLPAFRKVLQPLRAALSSREFLGGSGPIYADYLAFAPLQWARTISPFRLLEDDDPLQPWIGSVLDLHDGLARSVPAYY